MTKAMHTRAGTTAPKPVLVQPLASLPVQDRLRNNNFDGLRLIFASMVVLFHIGLLSQAPQLTGLHRYISSTFAVQAFFVVSGFLVTMSYENTKSLMDYGKKRLLRIAPAYVVVILTAAFLLVLISDLPPARYFADPQWRSYLFSNLILSNFKQPTLPGVFVGNFEPAVNGSLWTIKLEVMFYCTVPLIVWAIRRIGYKPVLAALVMMSIAWQCGFLYAGELTGSDLAMRLAKQLPGQLAFFGGGAFAYYRTRDGLPPPPAWAAATGAIVYAVTPGLAYTIVAPFCVTLIVYWASIRVPQLWSARRLGDFSYGLYLYHFPIAQVLIALGVFAVAPTAGLVAVCALALLASVVSWHLVEKRALRFAHRPTPSNAAL
jgi:peptidoglycan/LPS O-acetylase OafA/YrhL